MPLALELAAARTATMSVADLAARVSQRVELLTGRPRRDRGRHRTFYTYGEALSETDPEQALRWVEKSLGLARTIPVGLIEAMALLSLSPILARRGEPKAALDMVGERLGEAHATDCPRSGTVLVV